MRTARATLIVYQCHRFDLAFRHLEHVPCPAHGMEEFRLKVRVDLLAQIIHVHIDHISEGIEVHTPDVLGNERAAEHPSWVTKKKLQQRELLGCQIDTFVRAGHLVGHQVEVQVRQGEHRSRHWCATAQQGTPTREQFFKAKRLGEVVIGSVIKPSDLGRHGVACSQEQDLYADFMPPHFMQHTQTVALGQHDIEDEQVIVTVENAEQACLAV